MRFDRKKPGGGVEIHCRLENGKAWLGWKFHIQKDAAEPGGTAGNVTGVRAVQRAAGEGLTAGQSAPKSFTAKEGIAEGSVASKTVVPGKLPDETYRGACQVEVTVTDREGHLAAYGRKRLDEEEPLETLLLHPHSWLGMEDPYLYRVEACLLEREEVLYLESVDGRKKRACLTEKGRELCDGTVMLLMRIEDEIIGSWLPEERELYLSLTRRYLDALREKIKEL